MEVLKNVFFGHFHVGPFTDMIDEKNNELYTRSTDTLFPEKFS